MVFMIKSHLSQILLELGQKSGCHQKAERCFHFRGYQFPVCARCTGVFIGNIGAVIGYFIYIPYYPLLIAGCGLLFIDWWLQFLNILESTNVRRVITGTIGGYSLTLLYLLGIRIIIQLLMSLI